jgi:hypothetical protein
MSKEQYYRMLEFIINNDNELFILIKRICKNYNLHGKIQDKLTYSNLSNNSRNQIKTIFNSVSVKSSYVDLKLFFESMNFNAEKKEEWINNLFKISGIGKISAREEELQKKKELNLKLKCLEINFPELSKIIEYIKNNKILEKETNENLQNALKVISFLHSNNQLIDFSKLGATLLSDSKIIRENQPLFNLVFKLLLSDIDVAEQEQYSEKKPNDLYEKYNIISNPTAIKVTFFAPLVYYKNGICYDFIKKLWEAGESATLSLDNLSGIDKIEIDENIQILTCENESPFNDLIRTGKDLALIFTSGYPNAAVKQILTLLKEKREHALHWGDSDFDGLRIASIINDIIPVKLWKCDLKTLKKNKKKLIRNRDEQFQYKMQKFLIKNQNFVFKNELLFTIENGWLEQESLSE